MKEVTEYEYDVAGRIRQEVVSTEKFVETTTFDYDMAGRVLRRTVVIEELVDAATES